MTQIRLSGFADEIDSDFQAQINGLKKLGISYMEIRGVNGRGVDTYSLPEVRQFKQVLDEHHIKISSIGSPIGKISIEEDFQSHVEHFKHVVEIAHIMESSYIRIFSFFIPYGQIAGNYRDQVVKRLSCLADYARKEDVVLLLENEKGIYGDTASRCLDLMQAVSGSHVKAVFDPANFVQCNQDVLEAYELLKPYIAYVHIKDAVKNGKIVPAGMGDGNIAEILTRLKAGGYQGFLSLEPHLTEFAGLKELERGQEASMVEDKEMRGEEAFLRAFLALERVLRDVGLKGM